MGREILRLFVAGEPVPQPRHRTVTTRAGSMEIEAVSGHRIFGWKDALRLAAQNATREPVEKGVPLVLRAVFLFSRPDRLLKRKYTDVKVLRASGGDFDNLIKAVCDALNRIVWADDKQVTTAHIRKRYVSRGERPGVWIEVREDDP